MRQWDRIKSLTFLLGWCFLRCTVSWRKNSKWSLAPLYTPAKMSSVFNFIYHLSNDLGSVFVMKAFAQRGHWPRLYMCEEGTLHYPAHTHTLCADVGNAMYAYMNDHLNLVSDGPGLGPEQAEDIIEICWGLSTKRLSCKLSMLSTCCDDCDELGCTSSLLPSFLSCCTTTFDSNSLTDGSGNCLGASNNLWTGICESSSFDDISYPPIGNGSGGLPRLRKLALKHDYVTWNITSNTQTQIALTNNREEVSRKSSKGIRNARVNT